MNNPPVIDIQGAGIPSASQGVNGARYLQNDSNPPMIWGPKCNNEWGWVRVAIDNSEWSNEVPLPGSPIARYDFSDLDETSVGMVYALNKASSVPAPKGIISAPKNAFDNSVIFGGVSGCTISSPVGTYALVETGTAGYFIPNMGALSNSRPTGNYTMVIDCERDAGSDQSFQMGLYPSQLETFVATGTRQRFVKTVNMTSPTTELFMFAQHNGGVSAKLKVWEVNIFLGSADLEPGGVEYGGHCALTARPFEALNDDNNFLTATKSGTIMWEPDDISVQSVTLGATYKTNGDTDFNGIIGAADFYTTMNWSSRWPDGSAARKQALQWVNGGVNVVNVASNGCNPLNQGWRSTVMICGADQTSLLKINKNNLVVRNAPGVPSVQTFDQWIFNGTQGNIDPYAASNSYNDIVVYNSALSTADAEQLTDYLLWKGQANNIEFTQIPRIIVAVGDSITIGGTGGGVGLFNQMGEVLNTPANVLNYGIGGFTLAGLNSEAANIDRIAATRQPGQSMQINILIGANDLNNAYPGGASAYLANLLDYAAARKAAGFTVVLTTILPRTVVPDFNTLRAVVNAGIIASEGNQCDYVLNFEVTPMGPNAAASDPTLYMDGVHPTNTGYGYLNDAAEALYNTITS